MYITLDGVSRQYGSVWAIDRVTMGIARNEFVSLLGPSGSGKTTLLRIIAGLERPSQGRVLIDGVDVTELPPHKRGVAMVFQEFLLFPHRTVWENLAFPLRMLKLPAAEIEERVQWVVGILSLGGLEKRYPNQLSGGQQQRVALGRGLVGRPKALLLDEPLANLDRELRQEMEVEIRRHQTALGIPFIYVTHNQEEALSMSDRIAVVRKGRIEDFAARTEIYDRPKTAFIAQFVGRSNRFEGTADAGGHGLATHCGASLALPAPVLSPGSPALAFVKNEKLRLDAAGVGAASGPNRLACTVKDVILRGAYADYILAFGARELNASRPRSERSFLAGEAVLASFEPGDIDVFDVKGEQAA
ncbi:putative spermidine/putrescine transport system ATP-binding protein/spermidine/putrescine transport system ATP-binding protein [Ancylobacter sp. 3268]|uniref:ABC transporter ATP-binding protein n=1 Tax=Ancylobacter sp. 3268 TaxID=2817752 RepID=UPI002866212D|nr:ABC transporter ATP-binding protein [Ancylobacter sp. 3268]MDR6955354.1 putative spermidine/putrescine transport system ATP-binding protein/spermidine/putrescine transport system ATP-binding protein [Ancylobacter sp. 3268]